jgi:hypothetical protein
MPDVKRMLYLRIIFFWNKNKSSIVKGCLMYNVFDKEIRKISHSWKYFVLTIDFGNSIKIKTRGPGATSLT